jgi:hypothetical protein
MRDAYYARYTLRVTRRQQHEKGLAKWQGLLNSPSLANATSFPTTDERRDKRLLYGSASAAKTDEKRDHKNGQENPEQNHRDSGCSGSDTAKAKNGCNNRDDQKYYGIT